MIAEDRWEHPELVQPAYDVDRDRAPAQVHGVAPRIREDLKVSGADESAQALTARRRASGDHLLEVAGATGPSARGVFDDVGLF